METHERGFSRRDRERARSEVFFERGRPTSPPILHLASLCSQPIVSSHSTVKAKMKKKKRVDRSAWPFHDAHACRSRMPSSTEINQLVSCGEKLPAAPKSESSLFSLSLSLSLLALPRPPDAAANLVEMREMRGKMGRPTAAAAIISCACVRACAAGPEALTKVIPQFLSRKTPFVSFASFQFQPRRRRPPL